MTRYSSRTLSSGCLGARPRIELDLMNGDRRYGWIAGDRIGFVGFGGHVEAVKAAWVAHRTVMRRLARASTAAPMPDDARTFALTRYGGEEVILANEVPIAVLVRPATGRSSDAESYGFVVRMPGDADEIELRATAYRIYLALKSSGIPWTRRRSNVSPAAPERDLRSTIADDLVAHVGDTTTSENEGSHDHFTHRIPSHGLDAGVARGEAKGGRVPARGRRAVAHRPRREESSRGAAGPRGTDVLRARADGRDPRGARRPQWARRMARAISLRRAAPAERKETPVGASTPGAGHAGRLEHDTRSSEVVDMRTIAKQSVPHDPSEVRKEWRSFADVDDSSADSFPASDPPSWSSLRVGAPSSITLPRTGA